MRALGTSGYGNYAMRRDADAACQSLSGQDLGAGAVYCTVKEKQAPKSPGSEPARGADKVRTRPHRHNTRTRSGQERLRPYHNRDWTLEQRLGSLRV